jgi:hypothetical protein
MPLINWVDEQPALINKGKLYRHYKGNLYLVLEIATHSESLETVVVYQAMYGEKKVWVRPLEMFADYVNTEQGLVRRFAEVI